MTPRRVTLVFFAAAVILSLPSIPYELRVSSPPPPHGDDSLPIVLAVFWVAFLHIVRERLALDDRSRVVC